MAVKQNNTEANPNASAISNNAQSGGAVNADGSNISQNVGVANAGGVKTKINTNVGGVEIQHDANTLNEQCSSSLGFKGKNSTNNSETPFADGGAAKNIFNEFENILCIINYVNSKQKEIVIVLGDFVPLYRHLLEQLSRLRFPREMLPDEKLRIKEGIAIIGEFFAKPADKNIYFIYLRIIWQLLTESVEQPSPALAIIFSLFDAPLIFEAVQLLLDHQISDGNVRQTVRIFCNWISNCIFSQNIHHWICAILQALHEQQKETLLEEIALDNIENVFGQLVAPVLRPKVLPICYMFLSKVTHSPAVLHKIVPRIPKVFKFLKKQAESPQSDAKQSLQKLSELIRMLLIMFPDYDDIYQPVVECLKECQFDENVSGETDGDNLHLAQFPSNAKAGLINLGNTCYMNSVLQALANTKEFTRDILLCQSSSPLISRMQEQIALMLYSHRNELSPTRILQVARPLTFASGLQQDSSEFLSHLLETLHEQETNNRKRNLALCGKAKQTTKEQEQEQSIIEPASSSNGGGANDACLGAAALGSAAKSPNEDNFAGATAEAAAAASAIAKQENKIAANSLDDDELNASTIERTFGGKQVTVVRCLTCNFQSRNVDSFRDLQLSFPEHKNDCVANYSVQDLLDFYYSPEKLDGANKYFCDNCKNRTDAERSVRVINSPKNLIITLKHFKYDQKFHKRAKLMHKVFHDEKLYLKVCAKDTLDEIALAHYDLYASVVHSGYSMDSGHYYTYASDASNRWFKFNDNIVTPSKPEELHNLSQPNTPYILFYQMSARSSELTELSTAAAATTAAVAVDGAASAVGGAAVAMAMANNNNSCNQIVKVELPLPLKLEELPQHLREYVNRDNCKYNEEIRLRQIKLNSKPTATFTRNFNRRSDQDDSDDDGGPRSTGGGGGGGNGCGGNALGFNSNRYIC